MTAPAQDSVVLTNEFKLQALDELHRTLEQGFSGASERQRALLRYLVTEEIEGRGPRVKAYAIATDVLNRPADFDAQLDSIVRVEVGRLRQTLERHYLASGPGPNLSISIPKGQYRPVFIKTAEPLELPAAERKPLLAWRPSVVLALGLALAVGLAGLLAWSLLRRDDSGALRKGPLLAVAPVAFTADKDDQSYVGAGLQAEFAGALSEFDWLSVVPLTAQAADADPKSLNADFLLRSSVRLVSDRVATTILLLDARSGAVRWTRAYDVAFAAHDIIGMQRDIAARVGADVGNPFGVIAHIERTRMDRDEFRSDEAFRCELHALSYWSSFSRRDYVRARDCFEAIRERRPPDANSLAALSLLVIDPGQNPGPPHFDPVPRAAALQDASLLAQRAYELDNQALLPRVARYTAALCAGDPDAFKRIGRAVIGDYPNNPAALTDFGAKLLLGADDPEGWTLLQRARDLTANLMPVDVAAATVRALRQGEPPDLSRLRDASAQTEAPVISLLYLAAAARGDAQEMLRAKNRLNALGVADEAAALALINAQCWSQPTRKLVAEAIGKAF